MEEKKKIQWKHILHAVVSFLLIYIIAIIFVRTRILLQNDSVEPSDFFGFFQMLLFPGLFLFAGYAGTQVFTKKRYDAKCVLLPGFVFSLILLGIWYVSIEVSALCNMIAAQACYWFDHLLRGCWIVYGDEYTHLEFTGLYQYFILPFLYLTADFIYWLCFLLGNRLGCPPEKSKKKRKKKKK